MGSLTVLCFLSLVVVSINSLPVRTTIEEIPKIVVPETVETKQDNDIGSVNVDRGNGLVRTRIRDGMTVISYVVAIETDVGGGTFSGQVLTRVDITAATREDPVKFLVEDLEITSVQYSLTATGGLRDVAGFLLGDEDGEGFLEIETGVTALSYHFLIEFEGSLASLEGFYAGHYGNDETYIAMNLFPTHARRVFPCVDDPTEVVTLTMTIDGLPYSQIFGNTELENDSPTQFHPTNVRPHLWGMIAHNFPVINNPVPNAVELYGRPSLNMEGQSSVAINSFFNFYNEWTEMNYEDIAANEQVGSLRVLALPDVSTSWNSISIVGIWEPYIFMEQQPAVRHRMLAWENIAQSIARQWFGFAIFPSNWVHEWMVSGLGTYAAYQALINFQTNENQPNDETLLDFETLFVTNVLQESLFLDGRAAALPLLPENEIFAERDVREYTTGLMKLKAPAIMAMLRTILGEEDVIHESARDMLNNWVLQPVTSLSFIYTLADHANGNLIEDLEEWFQPYLNQNGYAVVSVFPSANGVVLSQQRFCFTPNVPQLTYDVPITFTTSNNPVFDDLTPQVMLGGVAVTLNFVLEDEESWVVFNLQGRGYYRVQYHEELWERIIMALEDPDRRQEINVLNRAAIIDDALNLARAQLLDYDIAFRLVLTMEHETEYAPWKAFVRNMGFLKKRLVGLVQMDEDLDPDIYLRMVRRTIAAIENQLGFSPDPNINEPVMDSLTRGLVMEHACNAGYEPCIAAAVDWFYSSDDEPTVNPNIPQDLRPAVYCTMVRHGDDDVLTALNSRLDAAPSMYERLVILEALSCSQDSDFINRYLAETIADNSPYSIEEKSKIFMAIAESSLENADQALQFLIRETAAIRQHYGGASRLEAIIFALIDNLAHNDLSGQFSIWTNSLNSNLDDSTDAALRARRIALENDAFDAQLLQLVYEWIDENDATKAALSMILVLCTIALTLFNH